MARAAKACSHPDCPNLQPCPEHARLPWQYSRRRERAGSGHAQQKRARYVLFRDEGVCHVCGRPGADEADHIVPLAEGGDPGVENMAPIHSSPCHRIKTQREAVRARA